MSMMEDLIQTTTHDGIRREIFKYCSSTDITEILKWKEGIDSVSKQLNDATIRNALADYADSLGDKANEEVPMTPFISTFDVDRFNREKKNIAGGIKPYVWSYNIRIQPILSFETSNKVQFSIVEVEADSSAFCQFESTLMSYDVDKHVVNINVKFRDVIVDRTYTLRDCEFIDVELMFIFMLTGSIPDVIGKDEKDITFNTDICKIYENYRYNESIVMRRASVDEFNNLHTSKID